VAWSDQKAKSRQDHPAANDDDEMAERFAMKPSNMQTIMHQQREAVPPSSILRWRRQKLRPAA